jgi:hypothetical protein
MEADAAKGVKELEREISRLKAIVVDQALENRPSKEIARETGRPSPPAPGGRDASRPSRRQWTVGPVVGQHRSSQGHESARAKDDAALRQLLREISVERPGWGYRRAHHRLRPGGLGGQSQAGASCVARGGRGRVAAPRETTSVGPESRCLQIGHDRDR